MVFELIITTVDKQLFHGTVVSVTVPGSEGELTILARHQPLITTLSQGSIIVRIGKTNAAENFTIKKGLLEVAHNQATILLE